MAMILLMPPGSLSSASEGLELILPFLSFSFCYRTFSPFDHNSPFARLIYWPFRWISNGLTAGWTSFVRMTDIDRDTWATNV